MVELEKCANDPIYFIKTYVKIQHPVRGTVPFELYEYQEEMIDIIHNNKDVLLLASRQLGKTTVAAIYILWMATFQEDKLCVIASKAMAHATEIMGRIKFSYEELPNWLKAGCKFYNRTSIEFDNGSIIKGYTIGISSSNRGTSLRSLSADMLFLDEMDFIPREIVEQVIMPIWTTHAQCRFRICSTPSGERGLFYTWCQNALENGWLHSHIPSWHPDNKRWLSIETAKKQGIPITESTEYQVKAITSAANYEREYGAEFGEEFGGVYKNHLLNRYLKKYGRDININNPDIFDPGFKQNINNYYIIGVDWNSYINGGQVVLMEYCRDRTVEQFFDDNQGMDVTIDFTGKYRLFYRRGITSKDSTQRKTREEIIRLFKIYKIDYIYVDYGAGDTNIEELTLFGRDHPELQLNRKLKVIDSGASVEHFDPVLGRLVKKRNKSLMVNFSALNLEENMYILPKEEDEPTRLVGQMRGYQVKNVTNRGDYTYEGDDHILDAFNLAIYGFQKEYGSILNNKIAYRIIFMNDPRFKDYPTRVQEVTDLSIISAKPSRKTHDPEKVIQRPRMPVHISMPRARPNINFRNRNSF